MRFSATTLLVSLLMLAACTSDEDRQGSSGEFEIEKHYQSGSFDLNLGVSSERITVADRIQLVLEASAGESEEVIFPELEDKLGEFQVINSDEADARLIADNRLLRRVTYELEPFLPGEYEIPPLQVRFADDDVIETEAITIQVESVLPVSEQNPDIKEIMPPVELPGLPSWTFPAIAALLVLGAGGYLFWRRRRLARQYQERPPLPHQIALSELKKLQEEDLLTKGQAKLFYLRLSLIMRRYIEDRFGLQAPERTTEEFLAGIQGNEIFTSRQKELLGEFLQHCDMVKFAEYQPVRGEIDEAINTCAQFIAETRGEQIQQTATTQPITRN